MSPSADPSAFTAGGTAAYRQQIDEAAAALPEVSSPAVGILHDASPPPLLGDTAAHTIPYADIPHVPASEGTLTVGTLGGTSVVELSSALHLYDGHTPREVTFPVRMLATAGVEALVLTGPAGSVNPQFGRGDLMLLTDHINFQGHNPLVGPNVEEWGPRFPDMTEPYDAALQRMAGDVAREEGLSLQKGIYLALLGPNEETTAEHRMARRLGADAVGTSMTPEVIAARHMDLQVLALSLITDRHLSGDGATPSTDDTLHTARSRLRRLLMGIVTQQGTADTAP